MTLAAPSQASWSIVEGRDLADSTIVDTISTRDAMERLSLSPYMFLVVVDDRGRLLGTLTDGDLRRSILLGRSVEAPVTEAMRANPIVMREDDIADAPAVLARVKSVVRFLPVVDAHRSLVGVVVERRASEHGVAALVMAGGRGRRLGERTESRPKPLIEVRGLPMIEHVVRALELAVVRDVYVSAHYLADQIEAWAMSRSGTARTTVIRETSPLGTAGAIGLLPRQVSGDVIVMNADVITGVDLARLLQFHRHLGTEATVAVATHEIEIPFGVVRADGEGRFLGIDEKPRLSHFVAAGIYILGAAARAFVEPGRPIDMPQLLARMRAAGLPVGVFPIHERWRDLGRPGDLEAEDGLDGGADSFVT